MYKLFTDGGARGNPGPAGIGGVLYKGEKVIAELSEYIGEASNNIAEYTAIQKGLQLALDNKVKKIECYLDSELIVKQLNKEYKVKDKNLAKIFVKVWNLSQSFSQISFSHVFRENNQAADALVNKALDKQLDHLQNC